MGFQKTKQAGIKTLNSFKTSLPILLGVLLLISLITTSTPKHIFTTLFSDNRFTDPLIGAVIGSVATGNPLTSYIIGGELLKHGISLVATVAFILSWVTVGIVQLPAESLMLGRRFALVRNGVSFVAAIIVAVLTVFILELL